jgi:hypothetical protein
LRASNSQDTRVADQVTHGLSELASGVADLTRGSLREGGGRILGGLKQVGSGAVSALKGLFD